MKMNSPLQSLDVWKIAVYNQPPFYRELRKYDGTLNTNVQSQKSIQLVAGWDYNFKGIASRPFRITAEAYYKQMKDVDVYDSDPMKNPDAVRYDYLTFDEVLDKKLGVMDLTAICLCRDQNMPLRVFNMNKQGALLNLLFGDAEGTLIGNARR